MTNAFRYILIWLAAASVAFTLQLNWMSATYSNDGWVPVGNDAFYHARRIIDSSGDPERFYEFDKLIHAPEGSLLTWPWGYDFVMSAILRLGQTIGLADDPVRFLAYIPPFAVLATISLVIGIGRQLELSTAAVAALAFCVALSPLTQGMHGIGSLDHHFAEYIAILSAMWSLLAWFRRPQSLGLALLAGVLLGVAPAVHNGLFLVQLVPLVTLGISWVLKRGSRIPPNNAATFGLSLIGATLMISLPSLPFRQGMFEYYLLSWFHIYVASCTALLVGAVTLWTPVRSRIASILGLSALLVIPIVGDVLEANAFIGKEAEILEGIAEARNLWFGLEAYGPVWVAGAYSGLVFLIPFAWVGSFAAIFRVKDRRDLLVCVHAVLMLPLLLAQFRFHYYGSLALYLPLLLAADRLASKPGREKILAGTLAVIALAYYPAVRTSLATGTPLANDLYYPLTRLAMPALAESCADDPGIVLARNNDGHPIRYHSACSVIANNFLLTSQHIEAVQRVSRMFEMSPQELLEADIPVKYVFVRARGILVVGLRGQVEAVPADEAAVVSDPLSDALLWGDPSAVPPAFTLVHEVLVPGAGYPYARLWKINRTTGGLESNRVGPQVARRCKRDK